MEVDYARHAMEYRQKALIMNFTRLSFINDTVRKYFKTLKMFH
jgi:hypothetical protein